MHQIHASPNLPAIIVTQMVNIGLHPLHHVAQCYHPTLRQDHLSQGASCAITTGLPNFINRLNATKADTHFKNSPVTL
jgi:hypothetical protein